MASIRLTLHIISLDFHHDDSVDIDCTQCNEPLQLHQPDQARPERLLGTCTDCGAWFLVDITEQAMVPVPTVQELREQ